MGSSCAGGAPSEKKKWSRPRTFRPLRCSTPPLSRAARDGAKAVSREDQQRPSWRSSTTAVGVSATGPQILAARFRRGVYDASDPFSSAVVCGPGTKSPEALEILVAGCGTYQAAFLAFTNPGCRSRVSTCPGRLLAASFACGPAMISRNLDVKPLDLAEVAALSKTFDYVVCTGVLRHLADPDAGLRALAGVLRRRRPLPHALRRYNRAGVYTLKELFGRIGLTQDAPSLDVIKATLATLPPWHHARSYLGTAPDLAYDGGLVDTFLHPQDRAYAVPEVLRAVVPACGARVPGVAESRRVCARGGAGGIPIRSPSARASFPKRSNGRWWSSCAQGISCHRSLACRPERAPRDYRPDFSDGAVMSYRPAPAHGGALDGQNVLARGARRVQLTPEEAGWLRRANGEVALGELLAGASRSASTGCGEAVRRPVGARARRLRVVAVARGLSLECPSGSCSGLRARRQGASDASPDQSPLRKDNRPALTLDEGQPLASPSSGSFRSFSSSRQLSGGTAASRRARVCGRTASG